MSSGGFPNGQIAFSFLKEVINKEVNSAKVVNNFLPNVKSAPLASKFWSKYDNMTTSLDEDFDAEKHEKYISMMNREMKNGPRDKYKYPVTTTQDYGWVQLPPMMYDDRDKSLFSFRKVNHELTSLGEKLAACKITEREKFTGKRFRFNRD